MADNYGKNSIGIGIGIYNAIGRIHALATNTTQIAVDAGGISLYGIPESPDHPFQDFDV